MPFLKDLYAFYLDKKTKKASTQLQITSQRFVFGVLCVFHLFSCVFFYLQTPLKGPLEGIASPDRRTDKQTDGQTDR